MVSTLAFDMAKEGDKIILDNQGVVKATRTKRNGVVKDLDYRDMGHHSVTTKHLTLSPCCMR